VADGEWPFEQWQGGLDASPRHVGEIDDDGLSLQLGEHLPAEAAQATGPAAAARTDQLVVHDMSRRDHAHAQLAQPRDIADIAVEYMAALHVEQHADMPVRDEARVEVGLRPDHRQLAAGTCAPRVDAPDQPFGQRHVGAQSRAWSAERPKVEIGQRAAQVGKARRDGQANDVDPRRAQPGQINLPAPAGFEEGVTKQHAARKQVGNRPVAMDIERGFGGRQAARMGSSIYRPVDHRRQKAQRSVPGVSRRRRPFRLRARRPAGRSAARRWNRPCARSTVRTRPSSGG
jgi:hypothetical protein